jgi:hypothetical protein
MAKRKRGVVIPTPPPPKPKTPEPDPEPPSYLEADPPLTPAETADTEPPQELAPLEPLDIPPSVDTPADPLPLDSRAVTLPPADEISERSQVILPTAHADAPHVTPPAIKRHKHGRHTAPTVEKTIPHRHKLAAVALRSTEPARTPVTGEGHFLGLIDFSRREK